VMGFCSPAYEFSKPKAGAAANLQYLFLLQICTAARFNTRSIRRSIS
jgi:hypothetical protein